MLTPKSECRSAARRLIREGVEPECMRIRGARGRRPYLRNLKPEAVEAFRRQIVLLVDRRGSSDLAESLAAAESVLAHLPPPDGGPAVLPPPFVTACDSNAEILEAEAQPCRPDSAGYFLIFADGEHGKLVVEHYTKDHRRTTVVTGNDPLAVARTLLAGGLVGALDHAAYLGRELERASDALRRGVPYVQDE